GWTSVWDAIWVTANEVTAQTSGQTRRAIILLSDGDDTLRRVSRDEAVEAAVKANTIVYSIGIEPDCHGTDMACKLDKKALRKVSEATGGRAFFPLDDEQLAAAFAEINQELRTQYLVAYSPTNKARDNTYRRIRIEIANPRLRDQKIKLTYREGYFAAPPRAAAPRRERAPQERLKRPPRRPKKR
ncbi:MAG: VWA domain-containing protein, partial [Acidobacteria bacterium]|nr:VWA domain-containing protein [Acidobacteriota bacterium]